VLLLGTAVLAAGALARAGDPAPAGPSWEVSTAPFSITFLSGSVQLTEEALPEQRGPGPAYRLSYATSDGAWHTLTDALSSSAIPGGTEYTVATDERGRTATVDLTHVGDAARVHWQLTPSTGVTTVWEALDSYVGEHFLGGGENENFVDLEHQLVPLKTWHACRLYTDPPGGLNGTPTPTVPVPFFASSHGYGLAVETSAVGRAEFAGPHTGAVCDLGPEPQCPLANAQQEVLLCFKTASLTYDVYAGTPAETLSAYVRATGMPMLPPVDEFGLTQWRDNVPGPGTLLSDLRALRRLHVPVESVVLDNPWEQGLCNGNLRFGPPKFPDGAARLVAAVHELGAKLMLWVSPYVRSGAGCPAVPYPQDGLLGSGKPWYELDLSRPDVFAAFVAKLRALRALGVDGVKGDRGDEVDLESLQLAGGPGVELQNRYPYLFDEAIRAAFGSGRHRSWAGFVRAAAPQSRTVVPGIWAGDQQGTFLGLQQAIRAAASAGASGFPVWGSDVGGYDSTMLTPEVFVRWAQLGSISPIFEVGGTGPNATPWALGRRALALLRSSAVLHYELFPYLYELAREAARTGAPVLRPLAYAFPADDAAWAADLELMVGPSLLALPVTVPGGQPSSEYFPAGDWVPLWGGPDVVGPEQLQAAVPLPTLPLYLRAGSALPLDFRDPLVWRVPWGVNDLDRPGRIGWVYAPAPGTTDAVSADERFSASSTPARITLAISGHRNEIQVLVLTPRVPRTVLVDGRDALRTAGPAGLRTRADGWTLARGRFHGVLVKVTATHATSHVTIGL
jgi:alpha-D-xyloside xylohydrolase